MITMMRLYYSMGATFLLINFLYTIVIPITSLKFLYSFRDGDHESQDIWVTN